MKDKKEPTALYRKYRPHEFRDVVGQEPVVKALQGAIALGNISHAYLFTGSRGTGKTSVARIFARAIGTVEDDLVEIDAASNRGIDDIRALREGVATLPFRSPYKVYIVDEAHMLTKEAWNAFLKTLEEPPRHAVFILATTEMEKVPETVLSRCQVFHFRKPTQVMLAKHLLHAAKEEGYTLPEASADLIALLGDGSFRDALGILEKAIAGSRDKKISAEEVCAVTGAPSGVLVNDFIEAVAARATEKGLLAVARAVTQNVDMKAYLALILQKLRFVLLLRHAPEMKARIEVELSPEDFAFVSALSTKKEAHISPATLLTLIDSADAIGRSSLPQLPLELAFIKITNKQ